MDLKDNISPLPRKILYLRDSVTCLDQDVTSIHGNKIQEILVRIPGDKPVPKIYAPSLIGEYNLITNMIYVIK